MGNITNSIGSSSGMAMNLSRRDFIHAGCTVAAASLMPKPALAWPHGSAPANPHRAVVNFNPSSSPYANLIKGFLFSTPPSIADSNGYPTSLPAADIFSNPGMPGGYWSTFDWAWTGTASMQIVSSPPIIVSGGGAAITEAPFSNTNNTGDSAGGNITLLSQTAPHVTFLFGINIQSISNNGSGLIRIGTKTGFAANLSTGQTMNISGAASNTNANGTWIITKIDAQTFDLQNSVFSTTGGIQGQAVLWASSLTVKIYATGTFSGFTGLIWCKTALYSSVLSGTTWDPAIVSQLQYLFNHANASFANRGWLRFMDLSDVQGSFEANFSNRMPKTYISYDGGNYYNLSNWTSGGISNGLADGKTFTCNTGRTGAYQDLEVIQGTVAATNTDQSPTLNDNSRGAVPIFNTTPNANVIDVMLVPTLAQVGTVLQWTFTASWIATGSHTVSYTIVNGDQSLDLFNWSAKIFNLLASDAVVGASGTSPIQWGDALSGSGVSSGHSLIYPYAQSAKSGSVLAISFTGVSGMCSPHTLAANTMSASNPGTFIYSADLGGFMYGNPIGGGNQGAVVAIPIEIVIELCNAVGCHCWWNFPVNTNAAYITAFTSAMANASTGLTAGLRFGFEIGNELWNSSLDPYFRALAFGASLGWGTSSLQAVYGWAMNRQMQYRALAYAAWTAAGRAASDLYTLWMGSQSQAFLNQNFDINGLQASQLNTTSFPLYGTYGGLSGGLAAQNWSSSARASAYTGDYGGRPCDGNVTATGMAMYWFSDYIGEVAGELSGTVAQNATWLQAALDYDNGLTSTAFNELVTTFTTYRGSAPITSGTYNNATGQVVLTLGSALNQGTLTQGDAVWPVGLTGTGAVSKISGNGYTSVATTSGTTVTFNATAGLGSITITGGTLVDAAVKNPAQSGNLLAFDQIYAPNFEAICAQYDASRATNGAAKMGILHYEGGPQWSFSTSLNNGTNSVNDSGSLSALTTQIGTTLGWNVSAYTKSGTNNASEMAQMILNLCQGWKLDLAGLSPTNTGSAANTGSYKNFIKTYYYQAMANASAASGREAKPGQYGYDGPDDTWGFFPSAWGLGGQYSNYDAMHEFNAGN